ncbi:MAG: hypothetical protein ACO1RX_20235 [Candidatus Sericytochromatia bacterium]
MFNPSVKLTPSVPQSLPNTQQTPSVSNHLPVQSVGSSPLIKPPSQSQSQVLNVAQQQDEIGEQIETTPKEKIKAEFQRLKGFLAGSALGGALTTSIEKMGAQTPCSQEKVFTNEAGYKDRYIAFLSKIPNSTGEVRTTALDHFYPDGQKSQGGSSHAQQDFDALINTVSQMPARNLGEVIDRATTLAAGIVQPHLFKDGNGRAALYSLYFELANHGFQLTAKPLEMHAKLFGEEEKGQLPVVKAKELMQGLSKREFSDSVLSNHLLRVEGQLKELEDDRKQVQKDQIDPMTGYQKKLVPTKNATKLAKSNLFANSAPASIIQQRLSERREDARAVVMNELKSTFDHIYADVLKERMDALGDTLEGRGEKKELRNLFKQYQEQLSSSWVKSIEADMGRVPSQREVKSWIAMNWPD